jgi:hypothetical protein
VEPLLNALGPLLGERGVAWIADPGRAPAERFLEQARERFDVLMTASPDVPRGGVHKLRPRDPLRP